LMELLRVVLRASRGDLAEGNGGAGCLNWRRGNAPYEIRGPRRCRCTGSRSGITARERLCQMSSEVAQAAFIRAELGRRLDRLLHQVGLPNCRSPRRERLKIILR